MRLFSTANLVQPLKKQPALSETHPKGAGCFFRFAANLFPLLCERIRVRASSCGTILLSEWRRVCPLPRRLVGSRRQQAACTFKNPSQSAGCFCHGRQPQSVGMAAQRHEHRRNTAIFIQKAACTFPNRVQAAFCR